MNGPPDDVPVLDDGTVTLRAHRPDDVRGVVGFATDPVSRRWTGVPRPYDDSDAIVFIESRWAGWERGSTWAFAVACADGVDPSGFAGSVNLTPRGGTLAEIGFGIHPAVRGRGVATRAVSLLLDWGFETRGLETVLWRAEVGNDASRRLAWRSGFTFEGTSRRTLARPDRMVDAWQATLLATDSREPKSRWLEPVNLRGPRVVLREPQAKDEQRYVDTLNDPESLTWLGTIPMPRDTDEFRARYPERRVGNSLGASVEWVVADPDTDAYLATISLFGFHSLDYLSAEVGYRTHPDARGRGLLTEALRLVIQHAFTVIDHGGLGLDRISLGAGDGNVGSQAVARACGFTETGRDRRNYDLDDGRVVDLVRFDLLRSEWLPAGG